MSNQLDLFGVASPAPPALPPEKPATPAANPFGDDQELAEAVRTVAYGYIGDTGIKHTFPHQAASTLAKLCALPNPFHRGQLDSWHTDGLKELQQTGLVSISYLKGKMARAHFNRARLIEMAQEYDHRTVAWCS